MLFRVVPLLLLAAALSTAALADPPATTPRKVRPVFVTAPSRPNPQCPKGSTVIVEVHGVPLLIPRTAAYRLTLDDGKTHLGPGRPGKDYDCNTPVIQNVRGIGTAEYTLGVPGGAYASEKSFAESRALALQAPRLRGSIVQALPGGIQKVVAPEIASELFALPLDAAPTYDSVPVIFVCDVSSTGDLGKVLPHYCRVAYLHPSGLPFTYDVLRADYPNDDFIAADKAKRKLIDDMIAGAKDEKDMENKDK